MSELPAASAAISGVTEQRNPETTDLDTLPTVQLIALIQKQDYSVADAVAVCVPEIAQAVDGIVEKLSHGGRLFYFGAGSSGRLGVLDAAECPPTFGIEPALVQAFIAGGPGAVFKALEQQEDSAEIGARDVTIAGVGGKDAVIGICASGRTPYVLGALKKAASLGAFTVLVTNNQLPSGSIAGADGSAGGQKIADVVIAAVVGPEALTGSTRMKAGSAQKMILNLISTSTMVKLGHVYENLMVDLRPNSKKLHERALRIISVAAGTSVTEAEQALKAANNSSKTAILMLKRGCSAAQAEQLLSDCSGSLRKALFNRQQHDEG